MCSTQVDKTIANSSTQDENTTTTSPTKHLEKTQLLKVEHQWWKIQYQK